MPVDAAESDSARQHVEVYRTVSRGQSLQDLLPMATSVLLHASLLAVGLLSYGTYKVVTSSVLREQLIVPEAAMIEGAEIGGIPNPGLGKDPNLGAAQNVNPSVNDSDDWARQTSRSLSSTLMQGGSAPDAADSVIGVGPHSGLAGAGGAGNQGGLDGGVLAVFGPPGGGMDVLPKSPFMGISGNAHRVVYICDASGSMMSVIPRVRSELVKAISILRPTQSFNIIVFCGAEDTALSKTTLLLATPENKRKALEMAQTIIADGATDPLPAIRLAFEQKPELIYILTDGFDAAASYDDIIKQFRKLNADKKVKVNTILVRSSGDPDLEKVARIIAQENGGVCKIVDRQDM